MWIFFIYTWCLKSLPLPLFLLIFFFLSLSLFQGSVSHVRNHRERGLKTQPSNKLVNGWMDGWMRDTFRVCCWRCNCDCAERGQCWLFFTFAPSLSFSPIAYIDLSSLSGMKLSDCRMIFLLPKESQGAMALVALLFWHCHTITHSTSSLHTTITKKKKTLCRHLQ